VEAYYYTILKQQRDSGAIAGFTLQSVFEFQPQFRKCVVPGCGWRWIKPSKENKSELKRYADIRECPKCGADLELIREMSYVCDFLVTDLDGREHVIDVKSSPYFQTEIFKLKRRMFEWLYPDRRLEMVFPKLPKKWDPNKEKVF